MKKKFSNEWKGSSKVRKQRKYRFNAPLHIKQKFMSSNLSKDLRKVHSRRSLELRKNDVVRVITGKFKNKRGKVSSLDVYRCRITIDGLQISKRDGSKASIPFHPSNVQIVELNTDDRRRLGRQSNKKTKADKSKEETKMKTEIKK